MVKYLTLKWPGHCTGCGRRITRGSMAILLGGGLLCLGCEHLAKEYRDLVTRGEARGGGRMIDKSLNRPSPVRRVPLEEGKDDAL